MKTSLVPNKSKFASATDDAQPETASSELEPPGWMWFIENPPGPEPSRAEVLAAMTSRLEPLDE